MTSIPDGDNSLIELSEGTKQIFLQAYTHAAMLSRTEPDTESRYAYAAQAVGWATLADMHLGEDVRLEYLFCFMRQLKRMTHKVCQVFMVRR